MRKSTDENFKHFNDVYDEVTSESHLLSLTEKEKKSHKIPFSPSRQSAKITGVVVQCGECGKWRCMYSQHKLKKDVAVLLNRFNEEFNYTCGVLLQDVLLDSTYERIQELIFVKANLNCRIEIEVTYYSACNDAICIYCGCDDISHLVESDGKYPICKTCISKKLLAKDKRTREGNKSKPR